MKDVIIKIIEHAVLCYVGSARPYISKSHPSHFLLLEETCEDYVPVNDTDDIPELMVRSMLWLFTMGDLSVVTVLYRTNVKEFRGMSLG